MGNLQYASDKTAADQYTESLANNCKIQCQPAGDNRRLLCSSSLVVISLSYHTRIYAEILSIT